MRVFHGTRWESQATGTGVWRQALLQIPWSEAGRTRLRFLGVQARTVQFPIDAINADGGEWD